jgi:cell division protein FtsL
VNARLRGGGTWLRIALATALGVALGAGALVWTRTEILSLRYELSRLDEDERILLDDVEKLRLELAALRAHERIEAGARRLGLRYPRAGEVIHLPDSRERP